MIDPALYDVSPKTGFLPEEVPLARLPDYFGPWENVAADLPALILARQVRNLVDKMPLLSTEKLANEREWRRAYSILGFIGHAYVWGGREACSQLPRQLYTPWIAAADHFGMPPVATFAGLCLWNFRTIIPTDTWDMNTLATLTTYTGSIDESWFYLISVHIEERGGPCLRYGLEAMEAAENGDVEGVTMALQHFAESIDGLIGILMRMSELCDPYIFYNRLRPFLAGWKNMADAGLPDGVWYDDEKEPRLYAGGSNAQSSLIQAIDVLLGVKHHQPGERQPPRMGGSPPRVASISASAEERRNTYLYEIRQYMPRKHREFLEDLEMECDIRGFVLLNADAHPELVTAYDACIETLRVFRSKHIQIVMRFISMQARRTNGEAVGIAKGNGEVGTGGTALMPFLKQARDETGDVAAGTWGRRLLTELIPKPESLQERVPYKG